MGQKRVVLLSGGMDSTTLLYDCIKSGKFEEVHALTVMYGQRHGKEIEAAREIALDLGIPHKVFDLSHYGEFLGSKSSLVNRAVDVPEGHYADESMKATVVPNRNMVLLSIALGYSIAQGLGGVMYAAHAGDHTIYPDCRPEFIASMRRPALLADFHPQDLDGPYQHFSKADIVRIGSHCGVPFERTWSCYNGRAKHCGKCGTCVERREAFQLAGVSDPTEYEEGA